MRRALLILAAVALSGCRSTDGKIDIETTVDRAAEIAAEYCRQNPQRCGATPTPSATPTEPLPEPTRGPSPMIAPPTAPPTVPPVVVTASPEPTPTSSPSPTATPAPIDRSRCYDPATVDKLQGPVLVYDNPACPSWARRGRAINNHTGQSAGVCAVDWRRGDRPGPSIFEQAIQAWQQHDPPKPDGTGNQDGIKVADGYIADLPRRIDAMGRTLAGNGNVIWEPEGWEASERANDRCRAEDYGTASYSPWCHGPQGQAPLALVEPQFGPWDRTGWQPVVCPSATPSPTAAPTQGPGPEASPPPVPGPLVPQPKDFRLYFVNGPNALKHYKDGCGEFDATQRFIGTLQTGERWGNACDRDHFLCAIDPSTWTDKERELCGVMEVEKVREHFKTAELCGGVIWDSETGIDYFVNDHVLERNHENPFARHYCAAEGTELRVKTCLPTGAKTRDGRVIPGGPGCSEKTFTVKSDRRPD